MADSLEDEFLIDEAYLSPVEAAVGGGKLAVGNHQGKAKTAAATTGKSKHDNDEEEGAAAGPKNKRRKIKGIGKTLATDSGGFKIPAAAEDQAEVWNRYFRKAFGDKMSQLEFEESALEAKHVYMPVGELAGDGDVERVADLVRSANAISKNFKHKGSPRVLVVCGSAIRAAELTRRLRPISKRRVAKLFSKHIKIEEQKKLLEGNAVDIGVGTPNRILKLIESGHLRITQLRLILVDCTKDQKMRMVIDMDETREDLYTLWKNHLAKLVCESAPSPESEQDGAKRGVRLRLFETSY